MDYETSEQSHKHCYNDQDGHENHLTCCICRTPNTTNTVGSVEEKISLLKRYIRAAYPQGDAIIGLVDEIQQQAKAEFIKKAEQRIRVKMAKVGDGHKHGGHFNAGMLTAIEVLKDTNQT